jgi:lipoprotein-anchoring transpeptidase ErfK/SrfK
MNLVNRAPRVGMVLEVRYRNAGQFLVSYCTNLSRGGLFVSTREPETIGTDSSNGCFRMINEHVIELYNKVKLGTKVVVL